jgi:hypothetical protein
VPEGEAILRVAAGMCGFAKPMSVLPVVENKNAKMNNGANALFLISAPSKPCAVSG